VLGVDSGLAAAGAGPWLLGGAVATAIVGALGAVAAPSLGMMTAYLTLTSVGTLLIAVGASAESGLSAALYYLVHSTLVVAGLFLRWTERRVSVRRRLSDVRVGPGTRLTVQLDVENRSTAPSSFLMLEDQLPPTLGRSARLVVASVPGRRAQRVSYSILPQVRGRYRIGPLTIDITDAFGLRRKRLVVENRDELLVTPEIEDLSTPPDAATSPNAGAARARQLLRTGEEYFTMRAYQEGDDLRRIHWPSVARTGASGSKTMNRSSVAAERNDCRCRT